FDVSHRDTLRIDKLFAQQVSISEFGDRHRQFELWTGDRTDFVCRLWWKLKFWRNALRRKLNRSRRLRRDHSRRRHKIHIERCENQKAGAEDNRAAHICDQICYEPSTKTSEATCV